MKILYEPAIYSPDEGGWYCDLFFENGEPLIGPDGEELQTGIKDTQDEAIREAGLAAVGYILWKADSPKPSQTEI